MIHTAGNRGDKVRSDCFVSFSTRKGQGIDIELNSKVKALYGGSITDLCRTMLKFFGIHQGRLEIEDYGALPFTLAARIEAVIKKHVKTDKEFLIAHPAAKCLFHG